MFWEGFLSILLVTSVQYHGEIVDNHPSSYEYYTELEASAQRIEEYGHICLIEVDRRSEACRVFSDEYNNAAWRLTKSGTYLPWKYMAVMRTWKGLYYALNHD